MRERLLKILRCTECKNNTFSLEKIEDGKLEIKNGKIVCRNCTNVYQIEDGIVSFLKNASSDVMRERRTMDEDEYITDGQGNRYKITSDTIEKFKKQFLSLPEGNGTHFFKRGGSFQTIREGSSRFYSTLNSLAITGKESILEIGACFSYAAFRFAERGCRVVALDISNYLKVAALFAEKAYFDRIFSDIHRMPFVDNTFDIVFGSAVLHHSKDLAKVFREIHRVLKVGGRLVLINESARGIFEEVHPSFKEMEARGFGDTSYTIPQWKKAAYEGGFKKLEIDFLSLADDYISRHKNRDSKDNFKLKSAYFITRYRTLERCLLNLIKLHRIFFRPKSWKLVCYK
ncbi:MAG: methyltransferase domain-containing protein [Candidatus Omnitrophica bacterium]|nr:methyltransferase domain-containing protein [Candidatus Omnitrophota bacterium]